MTNEDRMTNAPRRATRCDRGEPRGPESRMHCGICGAEGVNRVTCTGDAETHAALDRGYKAADLPRLPPRSITDAPPKTALGAPNADLEGLDATDAAEVLEDAQALAADVVVDRIAGMTYEHDYEDPLDEGFVTLREALVHEVVLTVVTRYPALVMGRLEHLVEESLEEALWVSTESHGLTRAEES